MHASLCAHCISACRSTAAQRQICIAPVLTATRAHDSGCKSWLAAYDLCSAALPCAGVGISGQEGMQAVMSSDFAIAQVPPSPESRLQLGAVYSAQQGDDTCLYGCAS